MAKRILTRRELLIQSALKAGGLSLGALGPFGGFGTGEAWAQAAGQKNHLVLLHLQGGYSASFNHAANFLNFAEFGGISDANLVRVGNGLTVHSSLGRFPSNVLANMATAGMIHNQTNHPSAQAAAHMAQVNPDIGAAHYLAEGMGGPSSNKLVLAGSDFVEEFTGTYKDTSMQRLTDMQSVINALGGNVNPYTPDRLIAARSIEAALLQSEDLNAGNPKSLTSMPNSYRSAMEILKKPVQNFNSQNLLQHYGLNSTVVQSVSSQLAMAELMIRANSNVILINNRTVWDNHGDSQMQTVFQEMNQNIVPALNRFFVRVYGDAANNIPPQPEFVGKNIVTVIYGDFAREALNSSHAAGIAATVIGPNVKQGAAIQMNRRGVFNAGNTPGVASFWAYLATLLNAPRETVDLLLSKGGQNARAGLNSYKVISKV